MESVSKFFKSVMDYVGRMTPSQVMMLLGIVAGTVVGAVFVVGWLNSATYSTLYSNLDQSEAGEVVSYLNDNKIPYQLAAGGSTIEVPSDDVYGTRISLASEGLPRSGNIGYSIFDENNLGMTDFLQNLNFRRALEGELTRTIMQLREVQAARVHIVMPKERLFRQDRKQATASVMLKLKGSGSLSRHQIDGITHLVASSVEGLKPTNIAIIDYNGNLLTSGREGDHLAGLSSSQLDVRKQIEQHLEEKAQSMLDDVLGPENSVVRVTASLNFQQIERTSETFDPNLPSVRSEERTKTSASSSEKPDESAESTQDDKSETTVTNYELNKTVEHLVDAVGSIDKMSVAVLVDGVYIPTENADGVVETVYQPRSQEELDRLAAIVKNAVGFDLERNDQIEMVNLAFDRQDLMQDQQLLDTMYQQEFLWDIGRKVGLVLLIAFLFFYLRKKSRRFFATISRFVPAASPAPAPSAHQHEVEHREPVGDEMEVAPEQRQPTLVDKMQETAKDQPEEIAKVIKTMMIE